MTKDELDDYQAERSLIELLDLEQADPRIGDLQLPTEEVHEVGIGRKAVPYSPLQRPSRFEGSDNDKSDPDNNWDEEREVF